MDQRLERMPPNAPRSASSPIDLTHAALPSPSSVISGVFITLANASHTNGSLTATHTISSTPLALSAAALSPANDGKCDFWQVLVKHPGMAKTTVFLPLK